MTDLSALALTCTLNQSPTTSSSELMGRQLLDAMVESAASQDVTLSTHVVRVADHQVPPGVEADLGEGDSWPAIRDQVLKADILVMATPTWMGQPSSVCQRVMERLDAELATTDAAGRPVLFDKVATAAVVGNEDGAHHITGIVWQVLSDVGFTIPAQGVTYWNGEAMQSVDFADLDETPEPVLSATRTAAANAVHLALALRQMPYPAS